MTNPAQPDRGSDYGVPWKVCHVGEHRATIHDRNDAFVAEAYFTLDGDRLDILGANIPAAVVCGLALIVWLTVTRGCG